ncbi:MAG: 30S ribosomal protein S9 [Candidatus Daviesbacteria bacterium]|nr:30S ribosomal protein S9 [Candidatus Daviesbacteria bacterium]
MKNNNFYHSIGRRKSAVARVRVLEGNSQMIVNGKPIAEVYRGIILQKEYLKPLELTHTLGKYTATIKVEGGGSASQIDAIVHGLSRSLSKVSEDYKTILKSNGLLTRDPRVRERRKYGLAGAARAQKSSPKR